MNSVLRSQADSPDDLTALSSHSTRLFDRVVQQHYGRVLRYAVRLTGCRSKAEDLTQETFLRAHRAFHSYDPARSAIHWLLRIAHNLFVDSLRARKRPETVSLDALRVNSEGQASLESQLPDNTHNPEHVLLETVLDERLERALSTLSPLYRRALLLCDAQGMGYEEIAEAMDCSLGTVRSRIHRARKMFQAAYAAPGSHPVASRAEPVLAS